MVLLPAIALPAKKTNSEVYMLQARKTAGFFSAFYIQADCKAQ